MSFGIRRPVCSVKTWFLVETAGYDGTLKCFNDRPIKTFFLFLNKVHKISAMEGTKKKYEYDTVISLEDTPLLTTTTKKLRVTYIQTQDFQQSEYSCNVSWKSIIDTASAPPEWE